MTILKVVLLVGMGVIWPMASSGQVTSVFACSGGPRDGTACESDTDCFVSCPSSFGVCVVIQGVCDGGEFDGFPCDCPGGTCVGTGAEGTCQGGPFAGDPCRTAAGEGTCGAGRACVGTQKVCSSGEFRGFGCLRSAHCPGGSCASTGRFCDGGDFADFSCAVSSDCNLPTPGTTPGVCRTPDFGCAAVTPTHTPTRAFTPTRTATLARATPTPTARTPASPPATVRTATRTPTGPGASPTPPSPVVSVTPGPNTAVVAVAAPRGADRVLVQNPETVPLTGKITRIGTLRTCTSFIRRAGSAELAVNPALPVDVSEGTLLTIGPCGVEQEFVQESCAIGAGPTRGFGFLPVCGAILIAGLSVVCRSKTRRWRRGAKQDQS